MPSLYKIRECRVCGNELETILDLGALHPSGFLRRDERPLEPVPHDLCVCTACRLVQLRHTVEPDAMFRQYWYQSGINEIMRDELADIVEAVRARVSLGKFDYVLDIGANDGTLLSAYPHGLMRVAFEPALNFNDVLHRHATIVVSDYFPRGLREVENLDGQVRAITAIACFYDLDDPMAFLAAVARLLHPDGVFVVQFQDWAQMCACAAFDNICTEHLFYPSLAAIERMATPHGLYVVDAETRAINGGSLRLYLSKTRGERTPNVEALRQREAGCEDWDTFQSFAFRCREIRTQIRAAVDALVQADRAIDVYGASTKFNTLAQWCGLDHPLLRQAWERSPAKVGLRTSGTNIPIVDEIEGRLDAPDALFVGIWQFRDAVLRREASYLGAGGTMIFPLPVVDLVTGVPDAAA